MTDHSSTSIRPPKNWQDFERSARILFKCHLNDPSTKTNGTAGQRQNGVDIYGRQDGIGTSWVGIQCKGKDSSFGKRVTEAELKRELAEAKKFHPSLKRFILITTAKDDVGIDKTARLLTDESARAGSEITVEVWGWDTLEQRINEHPEALKAFHPDSFPYSEEIIKNQDSISRVMEIQHVESMGGMSRLTNQLDAIQRSLDNASGQTGMLDQQIHGEIDNYRDLLREDKPKTALNLLEKLKNRVWLTASDRAKFRILTNIGSCYLQLSQYETASGFLREAKNFQPEDPIALANYALSFLIEDRIEEAIKHAQSALEKDESNASAAAYLIRANAKNESVPEPLSLVPAKTHGQLPVDLACVHFLRLRSDPKWADCARAGARRHPQDDQLKQMAAEAEMDAALMTSGLLAGEQPRDSINYEKLRAAAEDLREIWNKKIQGEEPVSDPGLPCNLAQILRVLGDLNAALQVTQQAQTFIPESADLKKLSAFLYLEKEDVPKALELLLSNEGDIEGMLLAAEIKSHDNPIEALSILSGLEKKTIEEPSIELKIAFLKVECLLDKKNAKASSNFEPAENIARLAIDRYPNRILGKVILASICVKQELFEKAKQALLDAKGLLNDGVPFFERVLLALKFEELRLYGDVVDILTGHVSCNIDSPRLRSLFAALINTHRRSEARELLEKMPESVSHEPFFLQAASTLHIQRGDHRSARKALNTLVEKQPKSLTAHLMRVDLLLRDGAYQEVEGFLAQDSDLLDGTPAECMRLAHLLSRFKDQHRAIHLGYRLHLENPEDPYVQLGYMGLLLDPGTSEKLHLDSTQVEADTAFCIENKEGESNVFIVEDDPSLRITAETLSSSHPTMLAAWGLRCGEVFKGPDGGQWRICWLKHKYLHALHFEMGRFELAFPDQGGFRRIKVTEEDGSTTFEEIKDVLKTRHDEGEHILDEYQKRPLPLDVYAGLLKIDVIDAWHGLLQTGRKFRACAGNTQEREIAYKGIRENIQNGCVVDAITFYVIGVLDVWDAVEGVCGSIGITESSRDVFVARYEKLLSNGDQPYKTAYWNGTHCCYEDITKERIAKALSVSEELLSRIGEKASIIHAESDGCVSEEAGKIRDEIRWSFLDPALAAKGSNRLLLCEDQSYRDFAVREFSLKAAWIQPVLMEAKERGILSSEKYSEKICSLIEFGHCFISLDSAVLMDAAKHSTEQLMVASRALFGKDADLPSHTVVAVAFFAALWLKLGDDLLSKSSTGTILERIFASEWHETLPDISPFDVLAALARQINSKAFEKYVTGWLKGHFLWGAYVMWAEETKSKV
ncbi:MAG: tetratricopeptide repeat protein [Proteobacteria bacterium]|nr:tetratricopeptide repeat protein [Pseudomonadota bacterium]